MRCVTSVGNHLANNFVNEGLLQKYSKSTKSLTSAYPSTEKGLLFSAAGLARDRELARSRGRQLPC